MSTSRLKTRLVVDLVGRGVIGEQVAADARRIVCRCLGTDLVGGFYRPARRDPRLSGLADRFYGMRPPPVSPPCSKHW